MDLPSLELRYLRYFVAVAEELNFRRAAERLHVTTPTLSMQIKKLEELLDMRLFERDTARVSLTAEGKFLLEKSRGLLSDVQEMLDGIHARLHIGLPRQSDHTFIPDTLKAYHERFPKAEVVFFEMDLNEDQIRAVAEGRIHIGFTAYDPWLTPQDAIEHLTIFDTPLRAVMSKKHPLASKKAVTLADLAAYPLLAIKPYELVTQKILDAFRKKKLEPAVLQRVSSVTACHSLLAAGHGISLTAAHPTVLNNPQLVVRPIKNSPSELRCRLCAVWKKDAPAHVRHFVELLGKTVETSLSPKDFMP